MNKDFLLGVLVKCLKKVHKKDEKLFIVNVGEDCLNHRLGIYLTKYLEDGEISVDLEYNRHLADGKFYTSDKRAIVDIVIHKRDSDAINICAIECKKKRASKIDNLKIRSLISDRFSYEFGAVIVYDKKEITLHWKQGNKRKKEILSY